MAGPAHRGTLLTSPLNRLPEGLLDFFAVKSMGEYPQTLNPELRGVLDLTRWYSDIQAQEGNALFAAFVVNTNASQVAITSAAWTAGGSSFDFAFGGANTIVPQGELWLVLEASVEWDFSAHAPQSSSFALVSQRSGSQQRFCITNSDLVGFQDGNAAATRRGSYHQQEPFFALPGTELLLNHFGSVVAAGGSVTPRVAVRIKRLQR